MSYSKKDFLYEAIKHNMEFLYNTAGNFNDRYFKKNFNSFKIQKREIGNFLKKFTPSYQTSTNDLIVADNFINAYRTKIC